MFFSHIFLVLVVIFLSSCNDTKFADTSANVRQERDSGEAQVKRRLEVSPSNLSLNVGDEREFQATLITGEAEKKDVTTEVTWGLENNEIGSIDSSGKLMAKNLGNTSVLASLDDLKGTSAINILVSPLRSIKVVPENDFMLVGQNIAYRAFAYYENGTSQDITEKAEWRSSEVNVAAFAIDAESHNKLQGLEIGRTTIFATFDGVEGTANLEVKLLKLEKLIVSPTEDIFPINQKIPYKVEAIYEDGSSKDVTKDAVLSTQDELVAKFSEEAAEKNVLMTLGVGDTVVLASFGGIEEHMPLKIVAALVTAIDITPTNAEILVLGKQQFKATAKFSNSSELDVTREVVWTSHNPDVATIENNSAQSGQASAIKIGTAQISATYQKVRSNEASLIVIEKKELSYVKAGNGEGVVKSSPQGINCSASCKAQFLLGTSVKLTAAPSSNSLFNGWGGACTGSGECEVSLTEAKTVTASFTKKQFRLTISKPSVGSGIISSAPAGINCGGDCIENYDSGASVTLTATASSNSIFTGWSGAGCSGTGSCMVMMSSDKTVTANFILKSFNLTVKKAGDGTGSVSSNVGGITCGEQCVKSFTSGTSLSLTATPANSEHEFLGWSGACSGAGACSVTMDSAKEVTATFKVKEIYLQVNFSRFNDHASWNNCLWLTINDKPEGGLYLGCNHVDVDINRTLTLKGGSFCNKFKFKLASNDVFNFSTSVFPPGMPPRFANNADQDLENFKGFKFYVTPEEGPNVLGAHVNDNGDGNAWSDTSFKITGLAGVRYEIENTSKKCD